jgi:16S rRNA (uracil1498-N3)-methyltransferase
MRVSRIHVDRPLAPGAEITLDERSTRYINQVLRLRVGQTLTLFNGDGQDVLARLTHCERRTCSASLLEVVSTELPPGLPVHLGIGISRGERMDLAIQKSVELGVTTITPLLAERSVVQLKPERIQQRVAHWRGIVTSACEQSGRSLLPELYMPCPLDEWLIAHPAGMLLYHKAKQTLATLSPPEGDVNLLIGPEGGLSDGEHDRAEQAGYTGVRLGPRVLRTETAPIAALAAIQVLWGDFR